MLYSVVHRSLQLSECLPLYVSVELTAEIKVLNTSLSKKDSSAKYFLLHFIFTSLIFG